MGGGSLYRLRFQAVRELLSLDRHWWLVDARDQVLGRMAVQVATYLMGRHKPYAWPHVNEMPGDHVVVVNARHVAMTGKKLQQKLYRHHTGYPGGLKSELAHSLLARQPGRVVEHAVRGMLPRNPTREWIMAERLHVYPDEHHPHGGQQPIPLRPVWRRVGRSGRLDETDDRRHAEAVEDAWNRVVATAMPPRVAEMVQAARREVGLGEDKSEK
ncbi:hypothetical protein CDCA_CDCA13G3699 [Cyanidium caldarium]|uniref:50S ribosomal protein L13 n=1 Tax=Cyanidium caldarium TaxID=2771 RepID=A0AAV9IZI7_CYACA|nr:hypothetical protein CDCA_CDCA13G3699 [Cyanidium caldarium]